MQKKQQKDAEDNAVTAVDDFIPERGVLVHLPFYLRFSSD